MFSLLLPAISFGAVDLPIRKEVRTEISDFSSISTQDHMPAIFTRQPTIALATIDRYALNAKVSG
ncbi:MAG: hypothetical protein WBP79_03720 [Candidatus Acidiferrales bacterium]